MASVEFFEEVASRSGHVRPSSALASGRESGQANETPSAQQGSALANDHLENALGTSGEENALGTSGEANALATNGEANASGSDQPSELWQGNDHESPSETSLESGSGTYGELDGDRGNANGCHRGDHHGHGMQSASANGFPFFPYGNKSQGNSSDQPVQHQQAHLRNAGREKKDRTFHGHAFDQWFCDVLGQTRRGSHDHRCAHRRVLDGHRSHRVRS